MMIYIPDSLYRDMNNKKAVSEILKSVPDTSLHFPGMKTRADAVKEIREIGENEIADLIET